MQDKNIAISELKKLIEKGKGKSVDTKFDRPSVVRQPNAQWIPKPSVLGKPTPFLDSLERRYFPKTKSVPKTNVSEGLSKPVTAQTLPQIAKKAVSNTNVLRPGMYRIDNRTAHTKALQLPQTVRNTNLRVSTSTRVNHKPNVSRPQLKSNQSRDKVLPNNSQVKVKKIQVEVHPRIPSVSNKMKSITMCKDSLNSKKLNVNHVCATCNKCLVDSNHFACVMKMLNDVHARTKKPNVVPISTRKPKCQVNKSIATTNRKKVALKSTSQKPQSYFRVLYKNTNKAWKERQSPSGYKWVPKPKKQWVPKEKMQWIVQLILFIIESGCTKHMMCNLKLLCDFVEKVYYVEVLNHNLLSVCQFCDADLEIAFRKSTCFVRDLQGYDLLVGNRGSDLYMISLQESNSSTPLCLMAKSTPTQAWLWHRILSYLNFDYINLLLKKDIVIGLPKLQGIEFLNKTLNAFFKEEGIEHQTSTARTPEHNGIVKRWNQMQKNLDKMKEKGDQCILVGYSTQSKGYRVFNKRTKMIVESIHIRFDEIKEVSETSVANNTSDANVPSQQDLDLLFGPLYDEFFNAGSNPLTNIQSTSAPSTHTNVHAEENNNDQAEEGEQLQDDEFTNPFCAPVQEVAESSLHNIDGFIDPDHPEKVYRLRKALYGLKQAPRVWYDKLSTFLTSKGFTKGLQIHQSPRGIFINQAKYTLKILYKHGMDKGSSIGTPMATKPKLDADLSGNPVDQTDYRSKIGSLMYLISSRPDIVKADSSFELTAFSDADHAGCIDSRKSTSRGIQFLVLRYDGDECDKGRMPTKIELTLEHSQQGVSNDVLRQRKKIVLIKQRIQAAQDRQKSYANLKRKLMEFKVGDRVMLKVSPWKGVVRFEPVEIMEREIKILKRSRIPLVKLRWNSRRDPEFTWKREDSFRKKYPHLFTNRVTSSTARS
nr:hypothetical protein [Tanacetum cinerariifolium]